MGRNFRRWLKYIQWDLTSAAGLNKRMYDSYILDIGVLALGSGDKT